MLSKNNYNEKLRIMKLQARQDHFSIRKLTIGAASVLLGFTFFGAGSQTVKADIESTAQKVNDKTESVSEKTTVNDSVITLGSSKNTETDGDKKGVVSTSPVPKSESNDTVSGTKTDVAKKADTYQDAKKGLVKDHFERDGSDQSDIESVRNNRKSDIESTIQTAQIRINKAYASSSKDQDDLQTKNAYLAQIDKIDTDVIAKLDAGKSVEEINSTAETAIKDILNIASTAELHFAKKTATDAITSKAKEVTDALIKDTDKDKVKQIVSAANQSLQKTTDVETVNIIKDKTINELNNLKNVADAVDKAEVDTSKTNQTANIDKAAAAAEKRINDAYNNLPATTQSKVKDALNKAIADIEQTKTKTDANINSATAVKDIVAAADNGLQQITASENQAYLSFAQGDAKETIKEAADKVTPGLSGEDQSKVNDLLTQANASIDKATDLITVTTIKNNTINAINNVKSKADAAAKERLDKTKDLNKANVDEAVKQAISRIESAYKNLTTAEQTGNNAKYQKALADIKAAQDAANTKIANATSENEIIALVNEGISNINKLADTTELDFVIINIKDTIQNHANDVIEQLKTQESKNQVETIVGEAFDDLNSVQNVSEANRVKVGAIRSIDRVKDDENLALQNSKDTGKANIDEQANNAKKLVNAAHDKIYENLDDEEKKQADVIRDNALKAIEAAQVAANAAIEAASDKSAVTDAVNTANKQFSQTTSAAELSFVKLDAKKAVRDEAAKIIKDLKNQSDVDTVNAIVNQANLDFESADSIDKVTHIKDKAISDIDNIKEISEAVDKAKLAASKANGHSNLNSAAEAAKKQISEAYNKLNEDQKNQIQDKYKDAIADIDATATEANTQIDNANDLNSITNIVATAINKFNETVNKAEIAFATVSAKEVVKAEANKIIGGLSDQSDKDLVNKIVDQADKDFATAKSIDKVFEIRDKAIKDIDAVRSAADQAAQNKLNNAKSAAIKELTEKQTSVNKAIDDLPNVSAENKSALKDKVNLYYQTAINNVEKANDFDQVDKEKNDGLENMDKVLSDAQRLSQEIALNQKKLDDYAQKAIENINNSNLSEADKEKAIKSIAQARDDAKNIVGQQPTVERADAAEKAGEVAIDAAEKAASLTDLEGAKLTEKIKVENAAENAKNKVQDEYNKLDQDGKDKEKGKLETALEAIEKAKNDAEAAISNATDKNDVNTISKTGIDKVNGVADDTSLEFAKEAAKETVQQISDIVKQNLKDPNDQNAVDIINKDAVTSIDAAKTIPDVTTIRDDAIQKIKQIKNAADAKENNDLSNAKSSSRNTVDVDANAALDRVNKAYEKLTETEKSAKKDEYDAAVKAIKNAKIAAEDRIDNATNVDAINAAISDAKQDFNTIATNTEVSFAKLAGKDKIQDAAAEANKVLSPRGQAAVKDIVTQANSDIEDAETVAKIEKITEDAINKIKALQDSEKTDLENAIKYANDEFEKKYKEAIARLKKEFSDSAKTAEVDNAYNKYKGITGSTVEEVNAKEIAAERELAKGEVSDTGTNAETRVDGLKHKDGTDYTDNEKKALKNQIEKDVLETNGSKDQSGTLDKPSDTEGIDTVRNEAVNKIISESIADSQEGENVLQHDPDVLLERLAKAHKAAVDKLQKFGPNINHDQTDKNYEEAKKALSSNPTDLATELAGEKLIANGALSDAKTAADNIVDSNTDYSSTVKDKIKQQIQKDFDEATNRIKESSTVSELITQKRNDGIDQLYRDATDTNVNVTNIINSDGGSNQITDITNTNPDNNQNNQTPNTTENNKETTKTVKVVLKHNAYLYDNSAHRANGVTLGIGSILETTGTETINDRQYYVLVDKGANGKKYYVAVGNVKGIAKKLHHNAYIYNQYGKRVRKYGKLKAGKAVRTYGSSVKIRGKKYYIVAKNRFVKAANFTSHNVKTTVKKAKEIAAVGVADQSQVIINKKVMHNAYLYDENGVRANGLVINAGSTIDVSTQKVINKRVYYALENGLYIAAGNIDAKKLKLKHNAYVYSKYGNRLGKKVLKKRKSIKTYGNPVKIKGKKYYTITTSKFVKKANVKG